jgi:hypothetical protein
MSSFIRIICPVHVIFNQIAYSHFNKGHGCKYCKSSKGELSIELFLKENNINYIREKTYNTCINKRELPFDFHLTDYNVLIEFNGIQHYEPVDTFGGKEQLIKQKENDTIKLNYCLEHNIKLYIIKYNEDVDKKMNYIWEEIIYLMI